MISTHTHKNTNTPCGLQVERLIVNPGGTVNETLLLVWLNDDFVTKLKQTTGSHFWVPSQHLPPHRRVAVSSVGTSDDGGGVAIKQSCTFCIHGQAATAPLTVIRQRHGALTQTHKFPGGSHRGTAGGSRIL